MRLNQILTLSLDTVTQTINSESVDVTEADSIAIVSNITNAAPTAKTFTVDPATDLLTITAHGYKTGLKGQASSSTTLPGGLSPATDYFVILVDANTVKLATTHENALAGTAIDITSTGTGAHTFTPTSLAGGMITVQYSLDDTTFINVSAGTAITASSVFALNIDRPAYNYIRLAYTLTAGQLSLVNKISIKKDQ